LVAAVAQRVLLQAAAVERAALALKQAVRVAMAVQAT
jgi:hypothetical protein